MWLRSAVLAFYVTGALAANVCQGLPDAPAEGSAVADATRSLALRLTVKPGGPQFPITVRTIPAGSHQGDRLFHSADIEVARCEDGKRVQAIELMTRQPIDFARAFHAQHVNFDGYLDFVVLVEGAATCASQSWWVFDPVAGKFVQNELTRELGALKAADYHIDASKHEIATRYLTETWVCGSTGDRYRVMDNRL